VRFFGKAFPMTAISVVMVVAAQRAESAPIGPCDIYQAGGTPCAAAHSTVRALYGAYAGNLYQVKRGSDSTTKDIGVLSPGGVANSAPQDQFCAGTTCTISIIYDQSGKGNNLTAAPAGGQVKTPDKRVVATAAKLSVSGSAVYAAKFTGGMGYRNDKTSGIAIGDNPESIYMVTSGVYYNGGCCFDYGNAETNNNDDGAGTMEAIYFGNQHSSWGWGNTSTSTNGTVGPWVEADLENGLFAGNVFGQYTPNTPVPFTYVTAMVKGKAGGFAVKGGNATTGTLKTMFEGTRPTVRTGYDPMKKQGAIILGIGGDNSNSATGIFYEGCLTTGYATNATDSAVQANIVAAKYGSTTSIEGGEFRASAASIRYDPSTAMVAVDYSLQNAQHVRMQVVDLRGRVVATLQDATASSGAHQATWDAKSATPGLYALSLEIDGQMAWSGRIIVGR